MVRATDSAALPVDAARTVLEERIRKRRQTFEEFVSYAEKFARQHGEAGTLSLRHLQRLVAGEHKPTRLRPATARLLERIFAEDIDVLLSSSDGSATAHVDGRGETRRNAPTPQALRVAVAVVVKETQVLVVSRRESVVRPDSSWQFPAGVVKPGADSREVAVAETLAETGVHCVHLRSLGMRLHPATSVYCDYHWCEYVAGLASNLDPAENSAVTWVDIAQLPRLIPVHAVFPPLLMELGLTPCVSADHLPHGK